MPFSHSWCLEYRGNWYLSNTPLNSHYLKGFPYPLFTPEAETPVTLRLKVYSIHLEIHHEYGTACQGKTTANTHYAEKKQMTIISIRYLTCGVIFLSHALRMTFQALITWNRDKPRVQGLLLADSGTSYCWKSHLASNRLQRRTGPRPLFMAYSNIWTPPHCKHSVDDSHGATA